MKCSQWLAGVVIFLAKATLPYTGLATFLFLIIQIILIDTAKDNKMVDS